MTSRNSDNAGWTTFHSTKRVVAEFRSLHKHLSSFGFIKDLSLASDDNPMVWRLQLHNFDADLPGGRQLNEDLRRLKSMYDQDYILMELEFPSDYPSRRFFARVVSPRCVMYSGHVSAGGSICLEALTTSGTPGSWQSSFTVESLLNVIMVNMIDTPSVYIQRPTGPGGMTGPLRVDFSQGNPCKYSGYSSSSARAAFNRTLENHRKMGWGNPVMDALQTGSSNTADGGGSSTASSTAASFPASSSAVAANSSSSASTSTRPSIGDGLFAFLTTMRQPGNVSSAAVSAPSVAVSTSNSSATRAPPVSTATTASGSSTSSQGYQSMPAGGQQSAAAAAGPAMSKPPRVQLEFDYPESWDHGVLEINKYTVRLVELPLPANTGNMLNSSYMTPASQLHDPRGHLSQAAAAFAGGFSNTTLAACRRRTSTASSSRSTYAAVKRSNAARRSLRYLPAQPSASSQAPGPIPSTLLPGGGHSSSNLSLDPLEAAAQQKCLAASDVQMLVRQCPFATDEDAKAALLLADGDLDGAAVIIAMTIETGGAAAQWHEMFGDLSSDCNDALAGDHTAVYAEVESLLQHMEANGGGSLNRSKVVEIERVQYPQLWVKYCIKRAELEVARGTHGVNEQLLYHGTSSTAVESIIQEGFDIRVANSGSYGRGTYFANSSSTAFGYCQSRGNSVYRGASSSNTGHRLLVARVALGSQCQGSSSCTKPPTGYDSVHGGGMCHVVFDNHQAYPEYIITLRQ